MYVHFDLICRNGPLFIRVSNHRTLRRAAISVAIVLCIASLTWPQVQGVGEAQAMATGGLASFLAARLGTVVRNLAVFLFELFVTLFALFFFFRDGEAILAFVRRVQPFEEKIWERILTPTHDLIHASVAVTALIAATQGCLGGTAFAIVGIGSAVFWGVLMAFLSLLPVVGSWPVWVPAAVWLFAAGHVARGAVLVGICLGLVGTIDNFMRPYLMSGHARLSALLVFISVLGGIAAFGPLGVVLGPIVVAAAMSLLDVHRRPELEA
jgi:predicted PurR-regulated permease PerM